MLVPFITMNSTSIYMLQMYLYKCWKKGELEIKSAVKGNCEEIFFPHLPKIFNFPQYFEGYPFPLLLGTVNNLLYRMIEGFTLAQISL